jgi:drug/metabolite transporter (DMT)-like permease
MRYSLLMHLVTLAWGLTAILGKLVALPAADLVLWRTLLAVAGFALLALALRAPLRLLPALPLRYWAAGGAVLAAAAAAMVGAAYYVRS